MQKRLLVSTILALSLSTSSLIAEDSNSAKHFGFSAVFGYATETFIHDRYNTLNDYEKVGYSTIIGTLPGLAKELNDTKFDNEDLAFDIAGAFAGSLLSNYLNNNVFVTVQHDNKRKSTLIAANYKF